MSRKATTSILTEAEYQQFRATEARASRKVLITGEALKRVFRDLVNYGKHRKQVYRGKI